MNKKEAAKWGLVLLLGATYGLLNCLTLGLRLPGSAAVVSVRPQVVIPILGGLLMGPLHGFGIGCLGNFLGDWLSGFGFGYWPFSLGNGLIGLLPGLLRLQGTRRVDNVGQFSLLLILIVAGNLLGIGVGMVVYQNLGEASMQVLTWAFFHPIIVGNVILTFTLIPPLLFLFRKISATFDIRLCASFMYLLIAVVLAVIYVLTILGNRAISSDLAGVLSPAELGQFMETIALNTFRFGGSIGIAVILASVGITFGLIQYLARPIRALTHAAQQLKDGHLDQINLGTLAQKQDEFGKLATVFHEAVGQVKTREERLKQAIQDLRLEINRDQEAQQVSEITETGYFHSLRRRALEIRGRKATQTHEKNQHQPGPE